jgi:hypothetical protein
MSAIRGKADMPHGAFFLRTRSKINDFICLGSEMAYFYHYHYTPYATEQRIISAEQGFLTQEQGISLAKAKIFAG